MEPTYLSLISLLNEENVDYVVIGGYAVIAHGYVRYTGDIDILVRPEHQNATRLVQALFRFGYTDGEFEPDDFTRVPNFLSFSRYDHWIDIMTFSLGITFDECFTNRKVIELDGVPINFINLPELIKTKQAVGRPKDLLDISELLDSATNGPAD